jgi:hypothetical protein
MANKRMLKMGRRDFLSAAGGLTAAFMETALKMMEL